jgi:hypothetical protein
VVYLKTDAEQLQRIVSSITVAGTGVIYELSCGERNSRHYEFEISGEVNELIKVQ